MNKKGFTMVEIISVITILALIMILVAPSIQSALSSSKGKLSEMDKTSIEEGTKQFVLDIIYCDDTTIKLIDTSYTCVDKRNDVLNDIKTNGIEFRFLKNNGYFEDRATHCKATPEDTKIIIAIDGNNKITVTIPDDKIKCEG